MWLRRGETAAEERGLLPEILVEGDQFRIIRQRQSFEEIIALERY